VIIFRFSSTDMFVGMTTMGKDMSVERLTERLTTTLEHFYAGIHTHGSHYSSGETTHESHCNSEEPTPDPNLKEATTETHNHEPEYESQKVTSELHCNSDISCFPKMKMTQGLVLEKGSDHDERKLHVGKEHQRPYSPSVELMTHPGFPSTDFTDFTNAGCGTGADEFSKSDERRHEIEVLGSAELQENLSRGGFVKRSSVFSM
jgi:hypothetical protein